MENNTERKKCPVSATLRLLGGRWKVLSAQLKELEYKEISPRVEYSLTVDPVESTLTIRD